MSSPWGSAPQRVAQKRNKREALLVAAARAFKQQGFASASLDQVAAQLGISKPTLYYYVRSKSALVQACALRGFEQALAGVCEALQSGGTLRVEAALKAYTRVLDTDFGWCMVRIDEWPLPAAAAQHMQAQRRAVEQAMASTRTYSAMQAGVWMRALEGVVWQLPQSQWLGLIRLFGAQAHSQPAAKEGAAKAGPPAHLVEPQPEEPATPVATFVAQPVVLLRPVGEAAVGVAQQPLEPQQLTLVASPQSPAALQPERTEAATEQPTMATKMPPAMAPAAPAVRTQRAPRTPPSRRKSAWRASEQINLF